ncbi:hypothetical protein [Nocardia australiensis]|uniref:hypothetical protein n=1 Tax=Nocardia australiensis TaxID=2887191 RepID=UPI0021044D37|nr:hypothetical protein [Nocardia australiensis]
MRNVFSRGRRNEISNWARISCGAVLTHVATPATDRIPAAVARIAIANNPHNGYGRGGRT